ncbi:hypothetical protein FF38_03335 [Lucilia cuprina]|uniref:Protein TsetseEP domain-containing protein n=1 Tax=Lucilia cuprina TaxID=7375 RepID=A0A0L0C236_LUCCU|nr:hypothetical protein FF38_03335 [Lucilia cuprina]
MYSKIFFLLFASILVLAKCSTFKNNVKTSTKYLGGINCLIESVFNVENIANEFIYDIQICNNTKPSKFLTQIEDYCKSFGELTENIIDAHDNICKNAAYNETTDVKKITPTLCVSSIRTRMAKLNDLLEKSLNYVTNKAEKITDSCSKIAVNNLKLNLPIFTELVEYCAKLFK